MTQHRRIEYIHASKFGNGAQVAEEFKHLLRDTVNVEVRHVHEVRPREIPKADVYVFSSPGRMGRPIGSMRRFLRKASLPPGAKYAILTTEMAPVPDKKTGQLPSAEETARWQRIRPMMTELLEPKHLTKVAETSLEVTAMRGPLETGWHDKVEEFASTVSAATRG